MTDCFVYLIAHHGARAPVKVGISKAVDGRLAALQTGNPQILEMIFAFWTPDFHLAKEVESMFHQSNAAVRLTGEWFDLDQNTALVKLIGCFVYILDRDLSPVSMDALDAAFIATGVNDAVKLVKPKGALH